MKVRIKTINGPVYVNPERLLCTRNNDWDPRVFGLELMFESREMTLWFTASGERDAAAETLACAQERV